MVEGKKRGDALHFFPPDRHEINPVARTESISISPSDGVSDIEVARILPPSLRRIPAEDGAQAKKP